MKFFFLICLVVVVMKPLRAESDCPVCNPYEYNPVCTSGRAFRSACQLKRLVCLGKVELSDSDYKSCLPQELKLAARTLSPTTTVPPECAVFRRGDFGYPIKKDFLYNALLRYLSRRVWNLTP